MICNDCAMYSMNKPGCNVQRLCHAAMEDDDGEWFVRRDPMDECDRPDDFEEMADGD